jgi:NCS2 family nucleobase:cation symporter-2
MKTPGSQTTTDTPPPVVRRAKPPKRPENLVYWLDERPPWKITTMLGLQHVILMSVGLIYPVLIARAAGASPEATQSLVSLSMLAGGVGTILQALRNRWIGSGFLCPEGPDASFAPVAIQAAQAGGLPLVYGMTVLSGVFEAFLSRVLSRLRAFFPTEVTGVVVAMVGVSVVPLAITNMLGVGENSPTADLSSLWLSLTTLAAIVGINVWGKGPLRQFALLIGMVFGFVACLALGRIPAEQFAQIRQASLFSAPSLAGLAWKFDVAFVLPFLVAIVGSTLKNMGDVTTCQRINDAAWTRPDLTSIRGGVVADAATTIVAGAIGGMGQASYSGNVGLSLAAAATSRVIAYVAGAIFMVLALFPKLAAVFAVMPKPVIGAGLIFAISFIIVSGLQIIMSRMLDARKILVVGLSMIVGIGAPTLRASFPQAPSWIGPLLGSALSVATVTAIALNALLRIGVGRRSTVDLAANANVSDQAANFLIASASAWAARREIVQRATMALGELTEAIVASRLSEGEITVTAEFDEFNLDVLVRYRGRSLAFTGERPDPLELVEDPGAITKLSSFLIGHYADRVEVKADGGKCAVRLHFDH